MSAAKAARAGLRVALLRGVNVGGSKRVPMAELRDLAEALGWQSVRTYIQSGNVVFAAKGSHAALEGALEAAIEEHFGFAVPVIVRPAAWWLHEAAGSPFADAESARANLLHLGAAKEEPASGAVKLLAPYCTRGERVVIRGDAIWIDYRSGVAGSKLLPAVVDRAVGSVVTMRNWKSVGAIAELLRSGSD